MLLSLSFILLALPARADVALDPPAGERFVTQALRVEGLDAHPDLVFLVYDPDPRISTWRAFTAGGESEQDLAYGGNNRGGGLRRPEVVLMPKAAYSTWASAAELEIARQREACAERGEGCMHISRFVPELAAPTGVVSCDRRLDLTLTGPASGPDRVVAVLKVEEASASSCRLSAKGVEATVEGKPVSTGGCAVPPAGGWTALGGALLAGLARRRRQSVGAS